MPYVFAGRGICSIASDKSRLALGDLYAPIVVKIS